MSLSETGIVPSPDDFSGIGASSAHVGPETKVVPEMKIVPEKEATPDAGPVPRAASAPGATGNAPSKLHLPDDRYLDREQSWVLFNERVLELATDESIPLLERVRFLAIFASNLDEFFMVRVAGLMRRMVAGFPVEGAGLQMASQVLRGTLVAAREAATRHAEVFGEVIQPELAKQGIEILRWRDLTQAEQDDLSDLFRRRIYPVLTPLVVDPSHPFPFISGLSLNLAVVLAAAPPAGTGAVAASATLAGTGTGGAGPARQESGWGGGGQSGAGFAMEGGNLDRGVMAAYDASADASAGGINGTMAGGRGGEEKLLFARVKVPPRLPRFLKASEDRYVPIEDVIAAHLAQLFGGLRIVEHYAFRVTRVRELEVDEEVTENLLQAMERELVRRRFDPAVRLEVEDGMPDEVLGRLVKELGVDEQAVLKTPGPLDLTGLNAIADLPRGELRYPAFVPSTRALPQDSPIFATLTAGDVLIHHPYDSFAASVEKMIEEAAADPRVLAIKQTLYRTGGESPIVDALIDAAEAGKEVVVVVEIKARFDERANIAWARKLEEAGCHVVYGFVGMKTHCKCVLIVREEEDGSLRRYCHIGTGNYHPLTARLYEDYGLLTADPVVGEDVTDLFNHLTGYSRRNSYRRLLVAPEALRAGIVGRIGRQAARARAGEPSQIAIKCNALVDEVVIDALYRASQAGVPVDLWVRGICALRPGVPGLSETIRVRSVLGRYLEHSRIYAFGTGEPDPDEPADARISSNEVWLGSADMMHRNLDRRVEVLVRVTDPGHARRLRGLIGRGMAETTASWWLAADGTWQRHFRDGDGKPLADIQESLIRKRRVRKADT